jgi:hypothetical protein
MCKRNGAGNQVSKPNGYGLVRRRSRRQQNDRGIRAALIIIGVALIGLAPAKQQDERAPPTHNQIHVTSLNAKARYNFGTTGQENQLGEL